jgi:hypothetical protein
VGRKSVKSFLNFLKKNLGGGRGENQVGKTKTEIRWGKKLGRGPGENKVRSGLRKGKQKRSTWDRKGNPIGAPSIHVGALVGAGSLC